MIVVAAPGGDGAGPQREAGPLCLRGLCGSRRSSIFAAAEEDRTAEVSDGPNARAVSECPWILDE